MAVAAASWSGVAHAGFAIGPQSGTTTTSHPTFTVYLEPQEQFLAEVWVATDTQMDSSDLPVHEVGSCLPSTPTGAQYTFSCQPAYYSNTNYGAGLPPGTYYWWLTFYRTDPGSYFSTLHISGPLVFTVPAPTPPANAGLVSPADGATVGLQPALTVHAPAGSTLHFYASSSGAHLSDGSPAVGAVFSCSFSAPDEGDYSCQNTNLYALAPGSAYFWWVIIDVGDTSWIYGPRTFTVQQPSGGGTGSGGGGSGGNNGPHSIDAAPLLPSSAHFSGKSVKQTRLSAASYTITKIAGRPKSIAVACWNGTDWPGVSGDSGDGYYSVYGFYSPFMPHWIHLSPTTCRGMETLLYHRPRVPNRIIANAVDTVTHEMIHAIGIRDEAQTECYAMQASIVMAYELGVPLPYANQLARLTLGNYFLHPPQYVDTIRCREDGVWDIEPGRPSPPWHNLSG